MSLIPLVVLGGCGEGLPPAGLDFSRHDRCSGEPPQDIDASASEIQCRVDDYIFATNASMGAPVMEQGTDVPGAPICCEVCAVKGTADEVCQATCKHELCSRARDAHVSAGEQLAGLPGCAIDDCGFDFDTCMETSLLHIQSLLVPGELPQFYALRALCDAHANDPVRTDGLFSFLEGLTGIPGASGELGNVQDVVGYCLDLQTSVGTGLPGGTASAETSASGPSDGADSTGGASDTTGMMDTPLEPEPPPLPAACGPHAEQRFWIRPTNNFGTWLESSRGVGVFDGATHEARVVDGGISYTRVPCTDASAPACIRLDQLSATLMDWSSGMVVQIDMLDEPAPVPVTDGGFFDVPSGQLDVVIRYEQDDRHVLHLGTNDTTVHGHIDIVARSVHLEGLTASFEAEAMHAALSLHAELVNTQPVTKIVQSGSATSGLVSLTAETSDADSDPVVHHWMIPGVGSWHGDSITAKLPAGRYAVILYADDVHRSRGVAARWLDIGHTGA